MPAELSTAESIRYTVYDMFCMGTSLIIGMYGLETGQRIYVLACMASLLFRGRRLLTGKVSSSLFFLDSLFCCLSFLDAFSSGIPCEKAALFMSMSMLLDKGAGWKRTGTCLHAYGHLLIARTALSRLPNRKAP